MKISPEQIMFECHPASLAKKAEISAQNRTVLYHCTSLDVAKIILHNKELRFSRIDAPQLNDQEEYKKFEDGVCRLVFLSCFSTVEQQAEAFFQEYGDKQGVIIKFKIKAPPFRTALFNFEQPVRATLPENAIMEPLFLDHLNHRECILKEGKKVQNWQVEVLQRDVMYNLDKFKSNPIRYSNGDLGYMYNLTAMGVIKDPKWENEKESRFLAVLRPTKGPVEIPNIEYLYIPIHFQLLEEIEIIYKEPVTTAQIREAFDQLLTDVPHKYKKLM